MSKNGSVPDDERENGEFDDLDEMPSAITHLPPPAQFWAVGVHRNVKALSATYKRLDRRLEAMEKILDKMLFLLRVVIYGSPGLGSVVLAVWWLYTHFTVRN